MVYGAIDLHTRHSQIRIVDATGAVLCDRRVVTTRERLVAVFAGHGPIRVLLDSGSTGLFLVERIAAKGGLTFLAEETTFGGAGSGRQPDRRGLLASVAVGGLRFSDALVTTTSHEIEPTGRYHGVLGLSIFQGYRITLDLARETLVLEPGNHWIEGADG